MIDISAISEAKAAVRRGIDDARKLVTEEATAIIALEIGLEVAVATFGRPGVNAILKDYAQGLSKEDSDTERGV